MQNRIKAIRKNKGLTVTELAKKVGLSTTHVSNIENHKRGLEIGWIEPFAKALDVGPIDILEGEWNEASCQPPAVPGVPEGYITVPLYDMSAAAGYGAYINKEVAEIIKPLIFERSYLRNLGNPKEIFGMFVYGDSMEPILRDGSLVLVDPCKKELWQGKIYLVRRGMMLYVKYIEANSNEILLKSANKLNYADMIIDLRADQSEDFEILGQIVWYSCEG